MSVTPRTRNPKGRGDRLRVELLDAATDLIAEHGSADSVTLRAVAARAGVSPTAVYRHFDDHEHLISAAVAHCWQEFADALEPPTDGTSDVFDRFTEMGHAYLGFAGREPGKYAVLFSLTAPLAEPAAECSFGVFGGLVDSVDAILRANDDDRDPVFVAHQVHTWIHGIATLDACPQKPPGAPEATVLIGSLVESLALDDRRDRGVAGAADDARATV